MSPVSSTSSTKKGKGGSRKGKGRKRKADNDNFKISDFMDSQVRKWEGGGGVIFVHLVCLE